MTDDDEALDEDTMLRLPEYKGFKPRIIRSRTPGLRQFLEPRAAYGLSVGCYAGGGAGIAVGFGRVIHIRRDMGLVIPSTMPFIHEGRLFGSFCGVALGVGFGPGVCGGWGYTWPVSQSGKIGRGVRLFARRMMRLPRRVLVRGFGRFLFRFRGRAFPRPVMKRDATL